MSTNKDNLPLSFQSEFLSLFFLLVALLVRRHIPVLSLILGQKHSVCRHNCVLALDFFIDNHRGFQFVNLVNHIDCFSVSYHSMYTADVFRLLMGLPSRVLPHLSCITLIPIVLRRESLDICGAEHPSGFQSVFFCQLLTVALPIRTRRAVCP